MIEWQQCVADAVASNPLSPPDSIQATRSHVCMAISRLRIRGTQKNQDKKVPGYASQRRRAVTWNRGPDAGNFRAQPFSREVCSEQRPCSNLQLPATNAGPLQNSYSLFFVVLGVMYRLTIGGARALLNSSVVKI